MHSLFRTASLVAAAAALIAIVPTPAHAGPDGQAIAKKSDCFACHAIGHGEAKKMGPNYADVAAKYAGDKKAPAMLANAIKKGSTGHWGSLPMPPHPQLSDADTKALVAWVLSTNKGAKPAAKGKKK